MGLDYRPVRTGVKAFCAHSMRASLRSVFLGLISGLLFGAGAAQRADHAEVVPLVAGELVQRVLGLCHRERGGPRPGPRRWIRRGELVVDRVVGDSREALDEVEVLAGSAEV